MNPQYSALRSELREAMRFGSRNEHQREAIWARMDALVESLQAVGTPVAWAPTAAIRRLAGASGLITIRWGERVPADTVEHDYTTPLFERRYCASDRYPKGQDPSGLGGEAVEPAREATRPEVSAAGGSQGNRQSGSGT